jgi:hypothetical protein
MVTRDRAVDDAEGVQHLGFIKAVGAAGRRRRAEIAEQRGVDKTAFEIELCREPEAASGLDAGRDGGDEVGAGQTAAQLPGGDRGGDGGYARMQNGSIVSVVIVPGVTHARVRPGRVMGGKFSAKDEHVRLWRAAPFAHEARRLGDRRGRGAGEPAGERIEHIGLDRLDDRRIKACEVDPGGEPGEVVD